ncbi:MAG: PEP-CTERM sorting domain-containing protein [Verrucomicrobiota bacterium]|nr:PEP-CTERM sorting domain-containing protein [Verrucomicrobiota bacterium]
MMNRNTVNTFALVAVLAATGLSRAELVGSFLLQSDPSPDLVESFEDLATRTSGGNAGTEGVVAGTANAIAGSTLGTGDYVGITGTYYQGAFAFFNVNRYSDSGNLISYDYDFSTYLSTHAAGTAAGEYSYSLDIDLSGRNTNPDFGELNFLISYSDGSSLSLDTSSIVALGAGNTAGFNALAADAGKYVGIGSNPAGTAEGVYSWDITSHIAASADGNIRVLFHDLGDYKGDIVVRNTSGIVAAEVIPEPAVMGLIGFVALAAMASRRLLI